MFFPKPIYTPPPIFALASITLFGGAGEIGGNVVLIEDKDAKIYLDFWQHFTFKGDLFYDRLQPRNARPISLF